MYVAVEITHYNKLTCRINTAVEYTVGSIVVTSQRTGDCVVGLLVVSAGPMRP